MYGTVQNVQFDDNIHIVYFSDTNFLNNKAEMEKEVDWMVKEIKSLDGFVTFCQGDMWWGNILYDEKSGIKLHKKYMVEIHRITTKNM